MKTVLMTGLGALGRGALEFLARSPEIDRIITVKRSPWDGPSRTNLTMIGAVFQGHAKRWEHHQLDLADTDRLARLLAETRPDAILHSATVQSPRRLMNARVAPDVRAVLRQARFGMWLPWHLLPGMQLMEAVVAAGVDTRIVNASFPDVVNPVLWRHFGRGPVAGAGNVEVCVAQITRYLVDVANAVPEDFEVSLVGSHALLSHGTDVPHHLHIELAGRDVTGDHPLETMLAWP
ncbi:MAG: NAD-dependent epimerase/dehydratase family protein, partial [Acidimicrobiia bacterium]|nr:NAD-dependent epimerase/dehydratase family protein [Acidimicrobiia bacterium]